MHTHHVPRMRRQTNQEEHPDVSTGQEASPCTQWGDQFPSEQVHPEDAETEQENGNVLWW